MLPNERAQYSALIDNILASSDLQTISAKQIRKQLQAALDVDISDKKVGFSVQLAHSHNFTFVCPVRTNIQVSRELYKP